MDQINFFQSADRKYIYSQIKNKVNSAMEKFLKDQENERIRLAEDRKAKEIEEELLLQEIARHEKLERVSKREDDLRAMIVEREKQDKAFADAMRLRLDLENSEERRIAESNDILKETKQCQLAQIEEKRKAQLYKKEEDCVWNEAWNILRDKEENSHTFEIFLRKKIDENDQHFLREQAKEKILMEKLQKAQARNEAQLINDELTLAERRIIRMEIEWEKEKKRKQCEMLNEQLSEIRERKKQLELEKLQYEKLQNDTIQFQIRQENEKLLQEKASLKESTISYMKFIRGHVQDAMCRKQLRDAEIMASQKDEICAKIIYNRKIADKHVNR